MRLRAMFPAIIVFAITTLSIGCKAKNEKWEYKVVSVSSEGNNRTGSGAARFASVTPSEKDFNELGNEGWELAGSYLEMETAWMNFGKEEYVTGLQPNVRPQRAVFIFKRIAQPTKK